MSVRPSGVVIEVFVKVVLLLGVSLPRIGFPNFTNLKILVIYRLNPGILWIFSCRDKAFEISWKEYVSGFYPKEESEMVAAGYEYIVDGWYAALRIVFKCLQINGLRI